MLAMLRMSQKRAETAVPPSQAKGPVWAVKSEVFARFAVDVNIVDNQGPIWVHSNTTSLVIDKKLSGFIQI